MSDAITGGRGAYVPCLEEPAPFPPAPAGAIVGTAVGFVAKTAEPAAFPGPSAGVIVGGAVGFVAGPCEQDLEPCGPGFPPGPVSLQAVWQNLSPGTTSPLNTTAGTVVFEMDLVAGSSPGPGGPVPPGNDMTGNIPPGSGTVAEPPGFISPGNYSYVKWDSGHSTHLITCQPILRFTVDPGAILFEFLKNGSLIRSQIADIVPEGTGPDYYLAVADNDLLAPDFLCIETGDELAIWATGDLSNLVSVDQGRILLQEYS